jgi:hypothetical protein
VAVRTESSARFAAIRRTDRSGRLKSSSRSTEDHGVTTILSRLRARRRRAGVELLMLTLGRR